MNIYILPIITSLGGGIVVGGALAAFISLLNLIPRLIQATETDEFTVLYQYIFSLGGLCFVILYFSDIYFNLGKIGAGIIGLFMGIFIGMFSSAIAEVLNVLPIIYKKFKIKDYMKWIIFAVLAGKVAGSLYFWTLY